MRLDDKDYTELVIPDDAVWLMINDRMKILVPSDVSRETSEGKFTLADVMECYEGTKEYDGIVAACQKWYYGYVSESAWCATFLSFCLAQLGLLAATIGTKQENVYLLNQKLLSACDSGACREAMTDNIERGDIIIFNWGWDFTTTSSKHVAVATGKDTATKVEVIGGNQDDMVCKKYYSIADIVAVYRPDYSKATLTDLRILEDRYPGCMITD